MGLKKVNLGCGDRYAQGWINVDFNSGSPEVISYNLLDGLHFADASVDVIYQSHILEHLPKQKAETFLLDCYRVLKSGGIMRVVVPDLENVCREYLNVLQNTDKQEYRKKYDWIVIELLDQLVRDEPGGEMDKFFQAVNFNNDTFLQKYLSERIGDEFKKSSGSKVVACNKSIYERIMNLNREKIIFALKLLYFKILRALTPKSMRCLISDSSLFGEKHKWMYDKYSLEKVLRSAGFRQVDFLDARTSKIENFSKDFLDVNPDGTCHKNSSLYCEAIK